MRVLAGQSLTSYNSEFYGILWFCVALVVVIAGAVTIYYLLQRAAFYRSRARVTQDLLKKQSNAITGMIYEIESNPATYATMTPDVSRRLYAAHEASIGRTPDEIY